MRRFGWGVGLAVTGPLSCLVASAQAQESPTLPAPTPAPSGSQAPSTPPTSSPNPATPADERPAVPANLDANPGPGRPREGLQVSPNGTRPPGSPLSPAEAQRQGTAPDARNRLFIDHADEASDDAATQTTTLTGNVDLRINGYHATCDRATYNRRTRAITLESNVVVEGGPQPLYADYVQVNTRTNEFTSRGGRTVLAPELVGSALLQPLIINGSQFLRDGNNFRANDGFLTTCDFPNPHYKIGFRQADVIPNNRIVLRDASFYRYDRKLFRVPYLVVPIRDDVRYSYLPLVGRSQEEGYFVKAALGYGLSQTLPGLLRVDLMQKKGIGLGFDQAYKFGERAAGTLLFYNLNDRNRGVANRNGRLSHQQYIGDTLATIQSDFQNNSYESISSDSQTGNTTLTFARATTARDSNLSLTRSTTNYGTQDSLTTTYQLSQTERLGGASNAITIRLNGSDNTNSSESTTAATDTTAASTVKSVSGRSEQNADIQATGRLGIFDANLSANRNLSLKQKGSGTGFAFSGTQKLPDFQLRTDTTRFKDNTLGGLGDLLRRLPASFGFGYGRFLENVQNYDTTTGVSTPESIVTSRFLFDFTPRDKTASLTPGGALSATFGGNFRQVMYREDTAQYTLTGNGRLTQKLGAASSLNLNYNYLRPYGSTPQQFRLDSTGANNNINATLTVDTPRTRASLISGYDLQTAWGNDLPGTQQADGSTVYIGRRRSPWQNLAAQYSYRASNLLQTRFTAAYNINTYRLLDLTSRVRLRGRGESAFDASARFDPRTYRFPQITEALTLPLASRDIILTAYSSYNSQTYKFDYRQFGLSYRFHDYEYNFSYVDQPYGFRTEKGVNFSIRLYALPAPQQQRTGQYGTPLDTGVGEVF